MSGLSGCMKLQKGGTFYGESQTWTRARISESQTWRSGGTGKIWPRVLFQDWQEGWSDREREARPAILRRDWQERRRIDQAPAGFGVLLSNRQKRWRAWSRERL